MLGCSHGLWAHTMTPRPVFTWKGRLTNQIVWKCRMADCTCHQIIKPDAKKEESE